MVRRSFRSPRFIPMLQRLVDDVLQRDAPFGLQTVYVDPRLFGGRATTPREIGWTTAFEGD